MLFLLNSYGARGRFLLLGAILIDQITKFWVTSTISYRTTVDVLPFFSLTHVKNHGVSFSFLSNSHPWGWLYFSLIALCICGILEFLWWRAKTRLEQTAYPLIIGGALGNVIDRVRFGGVIDFLDFHLMGYHWPAFNMADTFIVLGVVFLLFSNPIFKK